MDAWQKKNPDKAWVVAADDTTPPTTADDRSPQATDDAPAAKTQQGIYGSFSKLDRKVWEIEQARQIDLGKQIFHSADKLGSRTAISCDMCHPNAANTHPETYPKYQVQLQRVAMLRDMINWCIENPVKGTMLKEDDPRMKALEAYIIAQRRGVAMAAGKH
jgi:cytochrome c